MIQDVDALSSYLHPLVAHQAECVAFYRSKDINDRADAYSSLLFDEILHSNRYSIKKHKSNVSRDIVTNNISSAKRKQQKHCIFTNTESVNCNKHRKLVKNELSPCLNTVVRKQKKLCRFTNTESFDSNKHHNFVNTEFSPCLNTVVNRPVVSLFELQLAEKLDNLIHPIPHSITVAPSCMPITLMQNMRQTFRQ